MNANVSKTNGVKLLAAVMVMAMIVAGAAVVLSDSTVSAETKTSATLTTVENGEIAIATPADYYVSADVTITSAVTTDVNLYIAPNADIIITNEGTGKLNLYAATTAISRVNATPLSRNWIMAGFFSMEKLAAIVLIDPPYPSAAAVAATVRSFSRIFRDCSHLLAKLDRGKQITKNISPLTR